MPKHTPHVMRPHGLSAREHQLVDILEAMFQAGEQQQQQQQQQQAHDVSPNDADAIPATVNRPTHDCTN